MGADLDEPASCGAEPFRPSPRTSAPLTDQRASAAYRMTVATNVLEKTLIEENVWRNCAEAGSGMLHAAE